MVKTSYVEKVVKIEEQDEEDEPAEQHFKDVIREQVFDGISSGAISEPKTLNSGQKFISNDGKKKKK